MARAEASTPWTLRLAAVASTGDRFVLPPMLVAISRDLEIPLSATVVAAGAYFIAYGAMQPVWGIVSDRVGVVRTLTMALAIAALATLASVFADSAATLTVSRVAAGAAYAAIVPAGVTYVGDTVDGPARQRAMTGFMTGIAVGIAAGSALGGVLAAHVSWRTAYLVSGLLAAALAVTMRRLPTPAVSRRGMRVGASWHALRTGNGVGIVLTLGFVEGALLLGAVTMLPLAVETTGATSATAGLVTAAFGVAVGLFTPLAGRAAERMPVPRLIGFGALALAAACLVVAWRATPVAAVVAAALMGLGYTTMHSSLQTWATEVAPVVRGTVVSVFAGLLFLGSAASSLLAGGPVGEGHASTVFVIGAAGALLLGVGGSAARARWEQR